MAKVKNEIEIQRVCAFCEYSSPAPADKDGNEYVICSKKGLMREGAVCRKFSYDPLKRDPAEKHTLPETAPVDIDEL
jgi:hypothetical protein